MPTLHESGEDYLEAILMLQRQYGSVRSVDIANRLGVTKASVSKAMALLEARGYVEMARRSVVLTPTGMEVATRMLERHEFFCSLLMRAGVSDAAAAEEGCHMEHCLSNDSFGKLRAYITELEQRSSVSA